MNDGNVDCLGGTDEPKLCRINLYGHDRDTFYFKNNLEEKICIETPYLCDNHSNCMYGDDEQFCQTREYSLEIFVCDFGDSSWRSDIENFFCKRFEYKEKEPIIYFSLDYESNIIKHDENINIPPSSIPETSCQHDQHCHRVLDLRVWLANEKNLTNTTCLCPRSFYGDMCQYQNQRFSLTILFRALCDSRRTTFAIVSLIDDDVIDHGIIHSSQQFTYLSIRDCETKFHIYHIYIIYCENQRVYISPRMPEDKEFTRR